MAVTLSNASGPSRLRPSHKASTLNADRCAISPPIVRRAGSRSPNQAPTSHTGEDCDARAKKVAVMLREVDEAHSEATEKHDSLSRNTTKRSDRETGC